MVSPSKLISISNSLLVSFSSPTIPKPVPSSSTTPVNVNIKGVPTGMNNEVVATSFPFTAIGLIVFSVPRRTPSA